MSVGGIGTRANPSLPESPGNDNFVFRLILFNN